MLKAIAQAIVLRAIGVIITLSLVAAYAKYKEGKAKALKTARQAVVINNKVKAKTSVEAMQDLLAQLKNDVTIQLAIAADATVEERRQMKTALVTHWSDCGDQIDNGSVRDIYLTAVQNIADTAFAEKA